MAVVLGPVGSARPQFFTDQGAVLNGGFLYFYLAGTSTPQHTYTDYTGGTENANPVELDADGRAPNGIWFTQGLAYKIIAKDSAGVTLWTEDFVRGINDVSTTQDEWFASGLTPTYISATSFTLSGDQTTAFHEGRRLKITDAGGTKYATITASSYSNPTTTVTVAGDALASPTTAVSYGMLSAANPSISSEMIYRKGTAVASAATCDIWNTQGDFLHITGNTGPITSFGTAPYAGAEKTLIFDSTPTLTHNATTLQIEGGQNVVMAAGDRAVVRADTTANMIVTHITRASGIPVFFGQTQTANTIFAGPASGAAAAPAFRAPVGADGASLVYLATKTASASASLVFTSSDFSWTAYDEYEFHCFNLLPATNTAGLIVTVSEDAGGSYLATNYFFRQTLWGDNNVDYSRGAAGAAASWFICDATLGILNSGVGLGCVIRVNRPSHVLRHMMTCRDIAYAGSATANVVQGDGACLVNGTPAALDAIKFAMSSGNITSGHIHAYGIRKA